MASAQFEKKFLKKMIDTKNCQNKLTVREDRVQAWKRDHGGNMVSLLKAWVKIWEPGSLGFWWHRINTSEINSKEKDLLFLLQ